MTADKMRDPTIAGFHESEALASDYREHVDWLKSFARRQLGRFEDADDFVQETYIRVARYPSSSRVRPKPLLARILKNLIRDRARSVKREIAAMRTASQQCDVAAEAEQHHQLLLKQTLLSLPDPLRDVLLLSRFTSLSQVQIAERLGISVKTVEWRLAKALAYCAERLAE